MSTSAPDLPPNWGPRPNGRSAHSLLAPLYDYADVTDERLDDLESRSGTHVPDGETVGDVLSWGEDGAEWVPAPEGGGGGDGTTDHRALTHRDADNQHPISAITGLTAELAGKQDAGDYATGDDIPDVSDVIREGDARLSDPRTPTVHSHPVTDLDTTGTASGSTFLRGDGVWATPPGGDGGGPGGPVTWDDVTDKPATFPPDLTVVTPGDIGAQPAGDYLTAADLPAALDLSNVVRDDDPRLTDARPPTAHNHDGVYVKPADLPAAPTWGTLSGKPAVIAAGASATAARDAIGAGTSNLQLGTGPTTAAAGDHGHTLNQVEDTATRVAMTPAERTKLGGIATSATANASDAQLRARSSHTGTQAIGTVDGLQAALDSKTRHIVLGPTDPVPAGTPAGTLVFRRAT